MRSTNRILTTHVGSLVRPAELVAQLRSKHGRVDVNDDQMAECLDACIRDVMRKQVEIGIDIINDGEFGKTISWSRYVLERLGGFSHREIKTAPGDIPRGIIGKDRRDFAEFYAEYDPTQGFTQSFDGWVVTGPIVYEGQEVLARDVARLKKALQGLRPAGVFMTAVAPGSVAPEREDQHYASEEDALFAIADALNEEYRGIVDAGFMLQIDDAFLASYYDIIVPPGTMADYRKWAGLRVDAVNRALKGIPPERTRFHLCWGSWNGPHVTDVAFREIADLVLNINVGGYALEMANPRHEHEWQVWQDVNLPDDKVLYPGVISHSTNVVEHPELVAERITRLANLVGRDRVIASTDCGFAQTPFTRRVHDSVMWAKLKSLVAGADLASRGLWRKAS